jgi:hypothetical protein
MDVAEARDFVQRVMDRSVHNFLGLLRATDLSQTRRDRRRNGQQSSLSVPHDFHAHTGHGIFFEQTTLPLEALKPEKCRAFLGDSHTRGLKVLRSLTASAQERDVIPD